MASALSPSTALELKILSGDILEIIWLLLIDVLVVGVEWLACRCFELLMLGGLGESRAGKQRT
jgi:hypothetical protein